MQRPTANAPDRVRSQDGPPARVRLSRTRGWRLPPNTIKVDRTTRWGNPYDVREYGTELALHLFASTARGSWSNANVRAVDLPTVETLHAAHATWLRRIGEDPVQRMRRELRGRNLACWCAVPNHGEDDLCHAAILLRLANGR